MDPLPSGLLTLSSGGQRRSTRLQGTPSTPRDSLVSIISTPADRSSTSTPLWQSSRSTPGDRSACNTPQESRDHEGQNSNPIKRSGLRRKREAPKELSQDAMEAAMKPLSDEERRSWPGWVELESDPALFNFILREYGVKDVTVQEVFTLEDDMLNLLPKPVYGLIFLFKYWEEEEDDEAEELPKCPNHVWFANQTITNACATIALLNIVMNVPKIDLGENLTAFKAETKGLKPAYRGQTLGENEFIRSIHNSFARRMDMLNADLALSNEFDKWKRAKNAKRKKGRARKSQAKAKKKDEEEPGFHFIAYVPINGNVWRLDGMQRQPVNLGEAGKDWIAVARENINVRIGQYDDGLQFNLLSLCRSPLRSIPEQLAAIPHSISAVEKTLTTALPDWKAFIETENEGSQPLPNEPNLSKELIANSYASDSVLRKLKAAVNDPSMLLEIRRDLLNEQAQLQVAYVDEAATIGNENEQAARRKVDYTPVIYNSVKELAEHGVLKEIVRDLVDGGKMKQ